MHGDSRKARVLILVENLSVPFDRRVWQEALALKEDGYDVVVICPKMVDRKSREVIDGIEIHRYSLPILSTGGIGYLWEYPWAFLRTLLLSLKVFIRKPFQIVHGCNPPDFFFAIALLFKPFGVKFVYDQHDLSPETYQSRFDRDGGLLYTGLKLLERLTYFTASKIIATNNSYRRVAMERGNRNAKDVVVVRSAPDLSRFKPVAPDDTYKNGRDYLVCYLGTMGPQDGVDYLVESISILVNDLGHTDIHFTIIGGGDMLEPLKALAAKLGISEYLTFTGRIPNEELIRILSAADLCAAPDPVCPLNMASTMNKILEYMAMSKPIVSFNLVESRYSADKAAVYAEDNDKKDFAEKIEWLLPRKELREEMGLYGRERLESRLSWEFSKKNLLELYNDLAGRI